MHVDAHNLSWITFQYHFQITIAIVHAICFRTRPAIIYADRSQMFDYNFNNMWKHWIILFTYNCTYASQMNKNGFTFVCRFVVCFVFFFLLFNGFDLWWSVALRLRAWWQSSGLNAFEIKWVLLFLCWLLFCCHFKLDKIVRSHTLEEEELFIWR